MTANYVLLNRIELNAEAASITFSNIPQSGYTDLKLVASARTNRASVYDSLKVTFNGSSSSFTYKELYGGGSSGAGSQGGSSNIMGQATGNNATANTFGNAELYVPNYTGSNNKSYSADNVAESNDSVVFCSLDAGLWSSTAAITSISILPNVGTALLQYSTFSLYGLAATGTTPVIAPKAYGGTMTYDGTYWYHTFLSSGSFTPLQSLTCDYLVVAGGAGGGWDTGGGGGAGGLRCTVGATGGGGTLETALSLTTQAYTVTVGAGGAGSTSGANKGVNGSDSVFSTITSIGGGGGGSDSNASGANGGSGGGEVNANRGGVGGTGTANQGYDGGSASGVNFNGSGGGGAGAIGIGGDALYGGVGGAGVTTSISGTSTSYAGGGGGGSANTAGGAGGAGGGGAGGRTTPGTNGTANTGGGAGGGGASGTNPDRNGGAGGSGIVIVRYLAA